jgi:hypothetical protein
MGMESLTGGLLKLLGITGSGLATSDLAPPVLGPLTRDRELERFVDASKTSDPNVWSYYNSALNRPTTFDEQMRLWNDMASWDLVTAALTELVEEATQPDPQTDRKVWFECSDKKLEDELNGVLLVNIDAETVIASQIWHVAAFGNNFDRVHYEQGKGIVGLAFAHPMDVRRYWLEENRRCVGFKWSREQPDRESLYIQGQTKIERPQLNYGNNDVENLWYPWDFLHMRRMFRMRVNEHGEPVFDEAQGVYKKLRMAIDQMTVHRAQVQPDRYLVNIDVQSQPPLEQVRTVQRWRQTMRNKLAFGEGNSGDTLGTPNDFKSYYNAWALDTMLWMAKPAGFNHAIEKLPGTANVPDVYDIEMLLNVFYSVIGIPKSWVGIGDAKAGAPVSGKALLAQDMRFLRKVRALRQPVLTGYTWLGYMHAVLQGKDVSDIDIKAKMSYISTLEDELRVDVLNKQIGIMATMADMLDKFRLDKDAWIDLVLRKYMHLPDEVVDALRVALPPEIEQPGAQGEALSALSASNVRRHKRITETQSRQRMRDAFDTLKATIESRYGKSVAEDMRRQLSGEHRVAPVKRSLHELNRFQTLPSSSLEKAALMEHLMGGSKKPMRVVSSYDQFANAVPSVSRGPVPLAESSPAGQPSYLDRWSPTGGKRG